MSKWNRNKWIEIPWHMPENKKDMNITQEQTENKRVELINEVTFLTQRLEEVWRYHPNNPDQVDVLKETLELKEMISNLEGEIKNL